MYPELDGGPCTRCDSVAVIILDARHWCLKHAPRDNRPIYGPWRVYTKEEEHQQILASLKRENDFNVRWNATH